MELLLVRHGRPVRMDSGGADPGLTEQGHREAGLLGAHLVAADVPTPEVVWSSPMRRARETAEHVAGPAGVPVRIDERLAEFDLGAPAYVPIEEVGQGDRAELWRALETGRWGSHRFDPEAFRRRVVEAVTDIVDARDGGVVAVVCHGGVINSYLCSILERPHGMFCQLGYTSVSRVLASRRGHRQLVSINETAHLQLAPGPVESALS
ncbi:histidine phosphatase family protein [Actinomycetospora rhizophila]|uniref:Histidine phosphatase family protein n=1 Tax=Actinomycetospora rhizophila TaxID=1416876 RepID=A0ABV9ZHL0_9PSEU